MLQTIKDVVLQITSNITQLQHQMQSSSFQNVLSPQQMLPTSSFPSQNTLQAHTHPSSFPIDYQHSNPLQTDIQQPPSPINIPSPSIQSFIPPQSLNPTSSTPPNQLSPHIEHQITNPLESRNSASQSSFDKTIRAIDSDL